MIPRGFVPGKAGWLSKGNKGHFDRHSQAEWPSDALRAFHCNAGRQKEEKRAENKQNVGLIRLAKLKVAG